jgi:hypothetical protein
MLFSLKKEGIHIYANTKMILLKPFQEWGGGG